MTTAAESLERLRASRRKACRAYREKKKLGGIRAKTFMLSDETCEQIARIAVFVGGSEATAVSISVSDQFNALFATEPLQDNGFLGIGQAETFVRSALSHFGEEHPSDATVRGAALKVIAAMPRLAPTEPTHTPRQAKRRQVTPKPSTGS